MQDRREEKIKAPSLDRTGSNAEITSQKNTDDTSVTEGSPTEFTVRHEVSECLDTATQYVYKNNLCADARDAESYLNFGRSRYTCIDRCGQAPTYGRKVNECGCDARCKWLGDCCRDMSQMCPEYYNAEPVEYYQLLKRNGHPRVNFLVIRSDGYAAPLMSRISYHDISRNNELDEKPDILTDLALSLSDFKITKKELIFQNYLTYMEYSSQRDAFHFIPKTINLMCSFESLKSKSYAKALQLLPLCQVSRKYDAITRYRRPCQLNYILICRCKDGQNEEEHLHNACLGQNFSQNRDYRYQLWDNQADMNHSLTDEQKGIDHISNGQSASRSCIVPVEARVLHQDGLSGFPLCTCLAVMSMLEDLGLWNIRFLPKSS
ncbi:hypothetical protein RRG08_066069 [Elysia crispata]|uniref:SMB domain-containing protein n=1 Tax=Elysia crispata TaxID=231223 RepID=A0AAE0ZFQ1_9GAST|nr:hypothetical protein RRG08_066069 [Elysia crispata]